MVMLPRKKKRPMSFSAPQMQLEFHNFLSWQSILKKNIQIKSRDLTLKITPIQRTTSLCLFLHEFITHLALFDFLS